MKRIEPHEVWKDHKPRRGHPVLYQGQLVGKVVSVEGGLCYRTYPNGEVYPFIWCFRDGLNKLHDWPTKGGSK